MAQSRLSIGNLGLQHIGMKSITSLSLTGNPSCDAINSFWEPSRDDVFSEFRWPFATSILTLVLAPATITFPQWQQVYLYPTGVARVWTVFGSIGTLQVNPNDGSSNFVSSSNNEEKQEFEDLFVPNPTTAPATYNSGTAYIVGDYVTYNAVVYICIKAGTNKQPDTQTTYWLATDGGLKVIGSNNSSAYARCTYIIEAFTIWDPKFIMAFSYRMAANMAVPLTGDADKAIKMMGVYNAFIAETKRTAYAERIKKPNQQSGYVQSRG